MGPAFSLVLLLLIGLGTVAISYGVARFFVPSRDAVVMAIAFVVGAAFGALLVIVSTWLLGAREELKSASQVLAFFSQLAVASAFFGAALARVAYRRFIPKEIGKKIS